MPRRFPRVLFNSLGFLAFFAVVLGLDACLWGRSLARKWMLLGASYFFYGCWNPPFLLLLAGSTLLDYVAGLRIGSASSLGSRRAWLIASCTGNLGVLAIFKYGEFLLGSLWGALALPAAIARPGFLADVVLPVGISFYTFQTMSYTIDVYRRRVEPTRSLLDFAVYVAFFPQLVAGPILRCSDFLPQLERPHRATAEEALSGVDQAVRGFAKKVLLADTLGGYVDLVFADPQRFGAVNHWLAVYAYAFQIYFDFSGYTDIAIGSARIMGFRMRPNFNLPYLAASPSEFWTRWHISLSSWLRDYLYIPLGGSRRGASHTYRNLMVTMLLGGLWHGAAWSFVLWGTFHGAWLAAHRWLCRDRRRLALRRPLAVVGTFHLVCLGWVLFRAEALADVPLLYRGLVDAATPIYQVPPIVLLALAIGFASHLAGSLGPLRELWRGTSTPARALAYAAVALLIFLNTEHTVRFIYFQF